MVAAQFKLPPGPRGLPLLGNIVPFRRDQLGYLLKLQRTHGRMATIRIGRTPVVVLFRPEHVRYVLVENHANFTNREVAGGLIFGNLLIFSLLARSLSSKATRGLSDLVGDGLLTTDGAFHDRHRRLLQPAFAKRQVDAYAGLIVEYTRDAMARWQDGREIDMAAETHALGLRIIVKIVLGLDAQNTNVGRIMEGVLAQPLGPFEALLNLVVGLPFSPASRRAALTREGDRIAYGLMDWAAEDTEERGDILSLLVRGADEADGSGLTRQEVRDEVTTLIAAGSETTANTLGWTLYLLATHPVALRRTVEELREVLGGRDPAVEDLRKLIYLDRVVNESMRLYPAAWSQGRRAAGDFELDGYYFPAGTLVMFNKWVIHRLPDVWGDPDEFRPDRWEGDGADKLPHWAYFPFGVGPRSCLGMFLAQIETRLVLATVLQHMIPVLGRNQSVRPLPLITLRLKDSLRVTMQPVPSRFDFPAPAITPSSSSAVGCPHERPTVDARLET